MAKQIYIDENGNPIEVSGTINTAELLPISANDPTDTKSYIDTGLSGKADTSDIPTTHTQQGSGGYSQGDTLQINNNVLAHSIIVINFGRYGYGGSFTIDKSAMANGFYSNGIGVSFGSRTYVLSVSASGLITVVTSNDALNFTIIGMF